MVVNSRIEIKFHLHAMVKGSTVQMEDEVNNNVVGLEGGFYEMIPMI